MYYYYYTSRRIVDDFFICVFVVGSAVRRVYIFHLTRDSGRDFDKTTECDYCLLIRISRAFNI